MEHLAILRKSWKLLDKILSGEKKIESRWYLTRREPWDKIKKGEVVYFKESGEPVFIKAEVEKVLQFENLDEKKIKEILRIYGRDIVIENYEESFERCKNKKYCILIFLKNVEKIKPFGINKKGFGIMAAWICVDRIERIKLV